ncbi:MAG: hypothetical protein KF794_08370 [Xanthobacteraceae bacterium]|nr:hypothetical protein [Xanthobacteraceae bacterium]QYK43825.1 MAG: hypothetical protein KF794_08370 [Xanthobacteraceae bacterium]
MDSKFTDPNRVLKFGREKVLRGFLVIGLIALAFGIFGVSYDNTSNIKPVAYLCFFIGLALCLYAMHKTFNPGKPIAVLSPEGIELDIEWVKTFLIPWHKVKNIEKIDVRVPTKGWHKTYHDVTAVVVAKSFYDREIHVDNLILRGPGWAHNFIDNGDTVQVALNHAVLPASAEEIFTAVDTRWKAFRGSKPGDAPAPRKAAKKK